MRRIAILLAGVSLLASAGCGAARPNWFSPGNAGYQQRRAERFDPYPEPGIGPDVTGARPREFRNPRSEPVRTQRNEAATRATGASFAPSMIPTTTGYPPRY